MKTLRIYLACTLWLLGWSAFSQDYQFELSWENPQTHEYHISLTTAPESGLNTTFQMPMWRPGRYRLQHYAAGVSHFEAVDENGNSLEWYKTDTHDWTVNNPGSGKITIRYRYYANVMDAGSSVLNEEQAYFNGINLFMHVQGRYMSPCTLTVTSMPGSWQAGTALQKDAQMHNRFYASSYQDLVDAPTILSPTLKTLQFEQDGADYYIHYQGKFGAGEAGEQAFLRDIPRIVEEQAAMFGSVPLEEYHFIFQFVPQMIGHAVEHKYSSCYVLADRFVENTDNFHLANNVISHEFFHLWNVKRIRPASLWPYDFQKIPLSGLHWWTEGVTSYYTDVILVRAGLMSREQYYSSLSALITNLENSYATRVVSPHQSSFDSWIETSDYAHPHHGVSYYALGQRLGLLLDLTIRSRTNGEKSLDDVFRYLYSNYFERDLGVPENGIQLACEVVAGSSFETFFRDHVYGTAPIDYAGILKPFGLEIVRTMKDEGLGHLGIGKLENVEDGIQISEVFADSDASDAGLGDNMIIAAINGSPAGDFSNAFFEEENTGKTLNITALYAGEELTFEIGWTGANNLYQYVIRVSPDASEAQQAMVDHWLTSMIE